MSEQVLSSLHDVVSAEHPTYIGGGTDIMPLLKNEVRDDKAVSYTHLTLPTT